MVSWLKNIGLNPKWFEWDNNLGVADVFFFKILNSWSPMFQKFKGDTELYFS